MTTIVRNGYNKYPGAKSIKRKSDGKIISLKVIDISNYDLEIGDIVNRHLIDGDIVLFNRQPSLHRMSMMAHRIKILNYNTFRLNVSVTTPYNADFDGDEMNMHVPQSVQTVVELEKLAMVQTQIITPAQHKPIIALVQDSIIGSYLFTRYDNYLTKSEVFSLLCEVPSFNGVIPEPDFAAGYNIDDNEDFPDYKYQQYIDENNKLKIGLWSGRTIFSTIIPNINLVKKNNSFNLCKTLKDKKENKVIIESGIIKQGVLDKSILGTKENGIVHIIFNQYGPDRARQFVDESQILLTKWMLMSGFSVGLGDIIPNVDKLEKMKNIIKKQKKNVINIIEQVHKGILDNKTGKDNCEEFENQILQQLNQAASKSGIEGSNEINSNNRMICIVNSGSKGSALNIGQMSSCVGQQSVDGKRIPYGFTDRTLPHFHKYDDGAIARGFVENSFVHGLTPTEFFFHAMGGREGLIDTAVKTSETGYIQRKLVKGMEDLKICFDYTVRNADLNIIQFLYGDDGMDPIKIEKQHLPIISMNYDEIMEEYNLDLDSKNWKKYMTKDAFSELENELKNDNIRNQYETFIDKIMKIKYDVITKILNNKLLESTLFYPINIKRILETNLKLICKDSINNLDILQSDITPGYIFNKINELKSKLNITNENKFNENKLFISMLFVFLSPNQLIKKYKITKTVFDLMWSKFLQEFFNSICEPGELIGVISAQSIGEPSTQMTLNTFHFAGVSSKSQVTRGLPRFKELLSTTKNIKNPFMSIYLDKSINENKSKASDILNEITIIKIQDLIKSSEIKFEPVGIPLDDAEASYTKWDFLDKNTEPWVLEIKIDKYKLVEKNIKMLDIFYSIHNRFNTKGKEDDLEIMYSDENSNELYLRIKIVESKSTGPEEDSICVIKAIEETIMELNLTGIKNITRYLCL